MTHYIRGSISKVLSFFAFSIITSVVLYTSESISDVSTSASHEHEYLNLYCWIMVALGGVDVAGLEYLSNTQTSLHPDINAKIASCRSHFQILEIFFGFVSQVVIQILR